MSTSTKRPAPRDDDDSEVENVVPGNSSSSSSPNNNKRFRTNDSETCSPEAHNNETREPLAELPQEQPDLAFKTYPTEEHISLAKERQEPAYWDTHRAIQMQKLYGNRYLGKRIRPQIEPLIERYQCSYEDEFNFYYVDNERKRSVPFACSYAHKAHGGNLLAVADEDRRITLIRGDKTNSFQDQHYHQTFFAHNNAVVDVKWSPQDELLLTGSADHTARLWDVEMKKCIATLTGHYSTLRCVNFHPHNPALVVTAAREGSFKIFDLRAKQLPTRDTGLFGSNAYMYSAAKTCHGAHSQRKKAKTKAASSERSVTSAIFLPHREDRVITSGSYDGAVKLWDCRAGRGPIPLEVSDYSPLGDRPRGITDLKLDHDGRRLFCLRMDNTISMYNITDISNPLAVFKSDTFKANSFFVKMEISRDGRCIAAGSSLNTLNVWDINRPQEDSMCFDGPNGEVTSVSWGNDQFATCSDDGAVRIWKYRKDYE